MKTLLPNKDYILLDGEIYILSLEDIKEGDRYFFGNRFELRGLTNFEVGISSTEYYKEQGIMKITHSTASLQGVKQLDRSLFVKGVDVEELYEQAKTNIGYDSYDLHDEYFHAGYNANKNEFTKKELNDALCFAFEMGLLKQPSSMEEVIKHIRPLSLPSSIIIEGEEITINW